MKQYHQPTKMGRRRLEKCPKPQTLPSSPTHSSSSSDFEFTISISPRKSSTTLCPADELFYKGQLLPLHQSPRFSMVRTLLLASSSTSSSSSATTTTTASCDSTDSHFSFPNELVLLGDCDSSRPSSVTQEDELKRLNHRNINFQYSHNKKPRYFSISRFSSVFRKEPKIRHDHPDDSNTSGSSSVKQRMSATAKEVIRKYLKKVKPKISQMAAAPADGGNDEKNILFFSRSNGSILKKEGLIREDSNNNICAPNISHSFSGNFRYPRRRSCVSSCPSSMRSSPSHSGILSQNGFPSTSRVGGMCYGDTSSMEELQSAIQGAIAHCKNSWNAK